MSRNSRQALIGAVILILLGSACRLVTEALPAPIGTVFPSGQTATPSATEADSSQLPLIPITGENVVAMQCQFCVANETHAILIFPDSAYFDVDRSSPVTCLTADVVNGNRIVICRGPESTTFNLRICSDNSNCLEFPVALQPCALLQGGPTTPSAPIILTPLSPHKSNRDNNPAPPASTTIPSSLPPPPRPPAATEPPPPPAESTQPPKPTKEPKPTHEPKPSKPPKPTKMPKPTKHKP